MKHLYTRSVTLSTIVIFCISVLVLGVQAQDAPVGNYATLGDLNLYYEVHGEGDPLIVIHGGLGGIVEFGQLLPLLAESHQVIAVELQGHGRTADIDRPLSYENFADDIAALIDYLELEKADVMGYSLGGGVALQTAIRHPEHVNKLVLISAAYARSGIQPEFLEGMDMMSADGAAFMLDTPMYQFYSSVAPNLDDWSTLVGKVGELMRQDYDWSDEVARISAPVQIIAGDSDFIRASHAVDLFGLLGGNVAGDFVGMPQSQLAILPATSHFTILYRTDLLIPLINAFLDSPQAATE